MSTQAKKVKTFGRTVTFLLIPLGIIFLLINSQSAKAEDTMSSDYDGCNGGGCDPNSGATGGTGAATSGGCGSTSGGCGSNMSG